ncbi:MAG: tetratricopeptide repeat protein [Sedimentisphaerales bacterium]
MAGATTETRRSERSADSSRSSRRSSSLVRGAGAAGGSSRGSRVNRKAASPGAVGSRTPSASASGARIGRRDGTTRNHRFRAARPSNLVYHDRPSLIRDSYHYDYRYRDYHGLLRHRVIWPRYHFYISYGYGPWFTWRCFYPYYHRKYVFVSLGGYWPFGYSYLRYYWYGCHPYWWYGYYPIAREIQTPVYNYYTYNYYTDEAAQPADQAALEQAEQDKGPDQMTLADVYFEEAVKAFEQANYQAAATKFAQAMKLSPEDKILPFAYSQALLATGQYSEAAQVLRQALAKIRHASQDLENARAAGVLLDLAQKIKTSEASEAEEGASPTPAPAPQSEATIEASPLEPDHTVAMMEMSVEDETLPSQVADEAAPVEGLKIAMAENESRRPRPALAQMPMGVGDYSLKWQGVMFLASVCTIAVSAGIRGYMRG